MTVEGAGRKLRLTYADCEDAENAGGLIYVWRRKGVPVVVPTRVLGGGTRRGVSSLRSPAG